MRTCFGAVLILGLSVLPCLSQEASHRVASGDTLWDLSAQYWQDETLWPELWAVNPQVHNPHWIYPGETIFLRRPAPDMGSRRLVRLPLERLSPPPAQTGAEAAEAVEDAAAKPDGQATDDRKAVKVVSSGSMDFVSPQRVSRLGQVDNVHQVKVNYGTGEDIEFQVLPGADLQVGDLLTLIQDETEVFHPSTRENMGYYVEVLGHVEVLGVVGDRGVGRVLVAYDVVVDGDGLMAFRKPLREVELHQARGGIEGTILRGREYASIFARNHVVFLDKGSLHGVEPGVVLEVPVREGSRAAQGLVDLGLPLATMVVLTAEEKTSTGLIIDSRAALESGDRFTAALFSP